MEGTENRVGALSVAFSLLRAVHCPPHSAVQSQPSKGDIQKSKILSYSWAKNTHFYAYLLPDICQQKAAQRLNRNQGELSLKNIENSRKWKTFLKTAGCFEGLGFFSFRHEKLQS